MSERDTSAVWKYATAVTVSLLIGILTGQFIPNRNIATTDQLNAAMQPMQASVIEQSRQLDDLKNQVSQLTGELKARDLISRNP
jgi:hypothetical protein